ncbi:MAG: BMP family ABC transporter substrate-binding protein [Kiritimatiellae bacterium]|nr:BMP family ABC transporter substrate-binding protein [Kiritimatiellia bacterium]
MFHLAPPPPSSPRRLVASSLRRFVVLALASTALLAPSPAPAEPAPSTPTLRIAMLSDGGTFNDHSFNQSCREGLEALLAHGLPLYVQFYETTGEAPFGKPLAAFAERNYRLVVGVGYFMGKALDEVARRYPRTRFISVDGVLDDIPPNLLLLTFRVDQCAFPAGFLAAAWADLRDPEDPAVACIGGKDVSSVEPFIAGFRAGVDYYNETRARTVACHTAYVGSFTDPARGRRVAERLLADGADVLFGAAGHSGEGIIAAAADAGKWAIGVDTDQYDALPDYQDCILTSCLKRMDRALANSVAGVVENQFWGGTRYEGTLANHGVALAPLRAYETQFPEDIISDLSAIQLQIISGALPTGYLPPDPASAP